MTLPGRFLRDQRTHLVVQSRDNYSGNGNGSVSCSFGIYSTHRESFVEDGDRAASIDRGGVNAKMQERKNGEETSPVTASFVGARCCCRLVREEKRLERVWDCSGWV